MAHKSWRAGLAHRKQRRVLDLIATDTRLDRALQAQDLELVRASHGGDVPVPEIWNHLADRRQAVTTPLREAELLAGS